MSEANSDKLVLGKDVPWKSIDDCLLRVLSFTPMATVSDNEVRSSLGKYALCDLEKLNASNWERNLLSSSRIESISFTSGKHLSSEESRTRKKYSSEILRPNVEDLQN